jgi:acyl-CoA thioesterase I
MKPIRWILSFFLVAILSPYAAASVDHPVRVACVGNSITWGGLGDLSYPEQMAVMLGKDYDVRNFGVSGRTMLRKGDFPYWEEVAFYDALDFDPNIVVIELGTNDSKPQNWAYGSEYFTDYMDMVKAFREGGRNPQIYVCFPPPAFKTAWGITDTIIHYEIVPLVDSVARTAHTLFIDFYTCFTGRGDLFPDGIHPSAEGYGVMAGIVADTIRNSPPGFTRYFYARADTIQLNESTALLWGTSPGSSVSLNGSPVGGTDSLQIAPTSTFHYTLIAGGPRFSDTSVVTVRYFPPGGILVAVASPSILDAGAGDSCFISWSTAKGTTGVSFEGLPVPTIGGKFVTPVRTTTYAVTTQGDVPDTARITVQVLSPDSINRGATAAATASTYERHNPPALAADGRVDTYWQSKSTRSQWITLDLGRPYVVSRIVLRWGPVCATSFVVLLMDSAGNLVTQNSYTSTADTVDDLHNTVGTARFVKLLLLNKSAAESGYTLRELEVYGRRPTVSGVAPGSENPGDVRLEQNFPNPFNASTDIRFRIPSAGTVSLEVYDLLGQRVDELLRARREAGWHQVRWESPAASGVYLIRLQSNGLVQSKTCLVLR